MSAQKTSQPGDPAAKHVSFSSAHPEAADAALPAGQTAGDDTQNQPAQAGQGAPKSASQPQEGQQHQKQASAENGLEAQAKAWLSQQQWLQNIDVNQLSKQAKDLSNKAVEQINRLTPTQKVVGGALLVSGLSWLALRSKSSKGPNSADDTWQRSRESMYRGAENHS